MKCLLGPFFGLKTFFLTLLFTTAIQHRAESMGPGSKVRIHSNAPEGSVYRKTQGKGLPISLLERFRNEFPAAVEVHWEQKKVSSSSAVQAETQTTLTHRVRGWNLGQSFAAEYPAGAQAASMVHTLERPEDLAVDQRSEILRRWPDQTCVAVLCSRPRNGIPTYKVLLQNSGSKRYRVEALESSDTKTVSPCPEPSKPARRPRLSSDQQRLVYLLQTCPANSIQP
jgi:hypothetical protein